jgi:cyclophilin family peptidyl-prolyl cis-trans isomerase
MLPTMATTVVVETDLGNIEIDLEDEKAPKSVENFLKYVEDKHYEGTLFHRVIPGFMAQGGGYNASLEKKPTRDPVENEADNGLKNVRGTVAMARTSEPHSATAQFFVNVKDNAFLDHSGKNNAGWGYAVFGKVTNGMDIVDKIVGVPTGPKGPFSKDAPVENISIKGVTKK